MDSLDLAVECVKQALEAGANRQLLRNEFALYPSLAELEVYDGYINTVQ